MVTQETAMFNRSALDNIAYGRPGASEDEIIAVGTDGRRLAKQTGPIKAVGGNCRKRMLSGISPALCSEIIA